MRRRATPARNPFQTNNPRLANNPEFVNPWSLEPERPVALMPLQAAPVRRPGNESVRHCLQCVTALRLPLREPQDVGQTFAAKKVQCRLARHSSAASMPPRLPVSGPPIPARYGSLRPSSGPYSCLCPSSFPFRPCGQLVFAFRPRLQFELAAVLHQFLWRGQRDAMLCDDCVSGEPDGSREQREAVH